MGTTLFYLHEIKTHKILYHHNFGHHGEEEFWELGINAKISELNAAMGLALFPYTYEIITKRKQVCDLDDSLFENVTVQKLHLREEVEWNYSYNPDHFFIGRIFVENQEDVK